MNRRFVFLAGLLSTLLILGCTVWVGLLSIKRVSIRHEAQFKEALRLELELVTKTMRNDLLFGNLRVVRSNFSELADGGVFSGYRVRREGLSILEANVPPETSDSFVTRVSIAFSNGSNTESQWGDVTFYTPAARFEVVSATLRRELLLSASLSGFVILCFVAGLIVLLTRSVNLLAPHLSSVVLQEELLSVGRVTRFVWGPAIAQLEALADRLALRRQEAEQALTAATHARITQNLVHDLRTPLGVFERGLQSKDWNVFEKERTFMERALGRLHAMVEALRHSDLERFIQPAPATLNFQNLMDEVSPMAGERIVVIVGIGESFECVLDHPKIERAILNLLRNAIESGAARVEIIPTVRGSDLTVSVVDDGPGVPPTLAGQLFQRGWTHEKVGGSGLGLAYAREVARGHGGDLTYLRNDDRTIFCFELPDVVKVGKGSFSTVETAVNFQKDSASILLILLEETLSRDTALSVAEQVWKGKVTDAIPPGPLHLAAVYTDASRFDEVAGRIEAGVPVVFAKASDNFEQVFVDLAKRAKRGVS